jgi:hypothetical protein
MRDENFKITGKKFSESDFAPNYYPQMICAVLILPAILAQEILERYLH